MKFWSFLLMQHWVNTEGNIYSMLRNLYPPFHPHSHWEKLNKHKQNNYLTLIFCNTSIEPTRVCDYNVLIYLNFFHRKSLPNTPRKYKTINPKPSTFIKGLIQTVNQDANVPKYNSPTSKIRKNSKNSNKEEKKTEEEIEKPSKDNLDVEDNSERVELPKLDLEENPVSKSEPQKLEPIKSVQVRPAAVKLETAVHSESSQLEALDPGTMKPESILESPKREALQSLRPAQPHKTNGVEERKEKSKKVRFLFIYFFHFG